MFKRSLVVLGVVLYVSFMVGAWIGVSKAQDTPTPEGSTVVELPPVATVAPVVVVPAPDPVPAPEGINWPDKLLEAGLAIAVVLLAFKQGKLIPPETVDSVLVRFFELVKSVTATTETPLDDTLVGVTEDVVRKLVQQELAKQMVGVVSAVNNHSTLVG